MINSRNHSICYGCTACEAVCPTKAITMKPDQEGFLYPVIDEALCILCERCELVCQARMNGTVLKESDPQRCYALKHIDPVVRQHSSSGGAFTLITDYLIDSLGAVCYGACFGTDMSVEHRALHSKEHRDLACGSKYVQSNLKNTYREIYETLSSGRYVLFSGTPCQVAGLQRYLGIARVSVEKLITLDIICTGTPSPMIWRSYINAIRDKYNSEVVAYSFRHKSIGWRHYPIVAELRNGKKVANTLFLRTFITLFFSFNALRPSCYQCPYACGDRVSDITMGDFWQIERVFPEFADDKGVSLVLLNSQKGCQLFEKVDDLAKTRQCDACMAFEGQRNLKHPTEEPVSRKQFWSDYSEGGYDLIASRYGGYNFDGGVKHLLKEILARLGLRR